MQFRIFQFPFGDAIKTFQKSKVKRNSCSVSYFSVCPSVVHVNFEIFLWRFQVKIIIKDINKIWHLHFVNAVHIHCTRFAITTNN